MYKNTWVGSCLWINWHRSDPRTLRMVETTPRPVRWLNGGPRPGMREELIFVILLCITLKTMGICAYYCVSVWVKIFRFYCTFQFVSILNLSCHYIQVIPYVGYIVKWWIFNECCFWNRELNKFCLSGLVMSIWVAFIVIMEWIGQMIILSVKSK